MSINQQQHLSENELPINFSLLWFPVELHNNNPPWNLETRRDFYTMHSNCGNKYGERWGMNVMWADRKLIASTTSAFDISHRSEDSLAWWFIASLTHAHRLLVENPESLISSTWILDCHNSRPLKDHYQEMISGLSWWIC